MMGIGLNQRDNYDFEDGIGSRTYRLSPDSQCCITATAGAFISIGLSFGISEDIFQTLEYQIADVIDSHEDLSYIELAQRINLNPECDAVKNLYDYRGNPVSTNANYMAVKSLASFFGFNIQTLSPDNDSLYWDAKPRLIEAGYSSTDRIKSLFLEIRNNLTDHDALYGLGSFTSGGHYVNILAVQDDGLQISDPYGLPFMDRQGYQERNNLDQRYGTQYFLDWEHVNLKGLTSRIQILRGVS